MSRRRVVAWDGAVEAHRGHARGTGPGDASHRGLDGDPDPDQAGRVAAGDRPGEQPPRQPGCRAIGICRVATGGGETSPRQVLASAGEDGTIRLWSLATHESLHTAWIHQRPVTAVAWRLGEQALVSASLGVTVQLVDVELPPSDA